MADISKITLPSGTTYDIKDAGARELIAALESATAFLGVTTTALTDGATTNPITINGSSVTAESGDIVTYGSAEFIWNGSAWQEFGDLSALGTLAFKNSASGNFTPSGSVSQPTFSGTQGSVSVSGTTTGSVAISTGTGTANYTPAGNVTLTNENKTATVSKASSGTATYTPEGSVSAPTISVATAGSTATVHNPTKVTVAKTVTAAAPGATAPANAITYYSVSGETLSLYQIGYTTGDSITTSDVTVKTGDAAYSASQPSFTGTGARLVTDNIPVPTSASFAGTGAELTATFTGASMTATGNFTPEGTVSQPSFTGTQGTVTVS